MATKDSGAGPGGRKPATGSTGRNRNAYCSFCRKSYRDVGPLVEGPSDVYICGECIELCQSIIEQEKIRRGIVNNRQPSEEEVARKLQECLGCQQAVSAAIAKTAHHHYYGTREPDQTRRAILLAGPT